MLCELDSDHFDALLRNPPVFFLSFCLHLSIILFLYLLKQPVRLGIYFYLVSWSGNYSKTNVTYCLRGKHEVIFIRFQGELHRLNKKSELRSL